MEGDSRVVGANDEETSPNSHCNFEKVTLAAAWTVYWREQAEQRKNLFKSYYMKPVGENSGLQSSNNRLYRQNMVWQGLLVLATNSYGSLQKRISSGCHFGN